MRAGDILVLVRKRLPFAPALVSALKARGVPVAGADRLMLTEQIAVQDLMALGDALTLPDDDLALAAVLKSPLFGLDDADLMALAHGREGSLWDQLQAAHGSADRIVHAATTLQRWRIAAEREPPFEFYAGVLDRDGGRARMLARLGTEAVDAIDELLNLALAHDDASPPSLQGFLCRLRQGQREIKRDMEQGRDEVRVMTVHGAKGLEAPIVFLPDTCSTRSARQANSLLTLEGVELPSALPPPFLWPVKGTSKVEAVQTAKAQVNIAETDERNRLLYVALTRARDRLYVAGFEGAQAPPSSCWYNLIKEGLSGRVQELTGRDGRTVWQLSSPQTVPPAAGKARADETAGAAPLPAWANTPAPPEPLVTQPLIPSRLAPLEAAAAAAEPTVAPPPRRRHIEPAVLSPSQLADDGRFLRGNLTHALLEHLPAVPPRGWAAAAEAFLARHGTQLTAKATPRGRRRDPVGPAGCGAGGAVRPGQPRRGAHRRGVPPSRRHRPGAAPDRQDRPSGQDAHVGIDPRLQDQPPSARRSAVRGRRLPVPARSLPPRRRADLPRHEDRSRHPLDRRPQAHENARRSSRHLPKPPVGAGVGRSGTGRLPLPACGERVRVRGSHTRDSLSA